MQQLVQYQTKVWKKGFWNQALFSMQRNSMPLDYANKTD